VVATVLPCLFMDNVIEKEELPQKKKKKKHKKT